MAKTMKATNKKGEPVTKKDSTKKTRSHIDKKGHVYIKNTGRYNELTKSAIGKFPGVSVGD